MMKLSRWMHGFFMAVGMAVLSACVPPPAPLHSDSAAIGVILEKQWSEGGLKEDSHRVYFVRWNDSDDPTKQKEIIESNYHRDNRVYLLNAKPGRYSAVAAADFIAFKATKGGMTARAHGDRPRPGATPVFFQPTAPSPGKARATPAALYSGYAHTIAGGGVMLAQGTDVDSDGDNVDDFRAFATYFSEELVTKSVVRVGQGQFAVMGRFQVMMRHGIRRGDRVQRHFYRAIDPSMSDPYGMPILDIHSTVSTRAHLVNENRGREVQRELLEGALGDLGGTAWQAIIERALGRLR